MDKKAKVYFPQEKPKMKGILPFWPQELMGLKFFNFAQQHHGLLDYGPVMKAPSSLTMSS